MFAPHGHAEIVAAMRDLGVDYPAEMQAIERAPFEHGVKMLDELKNRVRKNWRKLAFELHPDKTGNDPVKTARFRMVTEIREKFEKATLRRALSPVTPPVVQVRIVHFRHPFSTMDVTSNSTTTTSYSHGGPFYVAVMRPNF